MTTKEQLQLSLDHLIKVQDSETQLTINQMRELNRAIESVSNILKEIDAPNHQADLDLADWLIQVCQ